jgi:hypothetical protein
MMWALQRYILLNDPRFYLVMKEKYNLIIDLYDFDNYSKKKNGKSNYYSKSEPFLLEKASPFRNDGYIEKKKDLSIPVPILAGPRKCEL